MAEKPHLAVFGATGAQGGSAIRALAVSHEASGFRIRTLCRDTGKDAAQLLASSEVEVVSAELSVERDVRRVLAGAHTVFLITAYTGNPGSREKEVQQGKLVTTGSKFSILRDGMVYISLFAPGHFVVQENGLPGTLRLELCLPVDDANIPLIDITDDFGKFVVAALPRRDEFLGKRILAAETYDSMREIAAAVNKSRAVHGSTCIVKQLSDDEYLRFQPSYGPKTDKRQIERQIRFGFMREFGYYQHGSLEGNKRVTVMEPTLYTRTGLIDALEAFRSSAEVI